MPNNECIPFFEPASRITGHTTAAVVGKTFAAISAAITGGIIGTENIQVATCGAGVKAVGVFAYDEVSGAEVPLLNGPGMIVPVTAGAAITAGQEVQSDASGRAIPLAAGKSLGVAVDSAANGADCPVRLST